MEMLTPTPIPSATPWAFDVIQFTGASLNAGSSMLPVAAVVMAFILAVGFVLFVFRALRQDL